MDRKQILVRHFGDVKQYISEISPIKFSGSIEYAYFFQETEISKTLNMLTKTYPGYIWEIKTVYRV